MSVLQRPPDHNPSASEIAAFLAAQRRRRDAEWRLEPLPPGVVVAPDLVTLLRLVASTADPHCCGGLGLVELAICTRLGLTCGFGRCARRQLATHGDPL